MSETSLSGALLEAITAGLATANQITRGRYPGDSIATQPVHTVYGGAHLFTANIVQRLRSAAISIFDEHAPDAATLAEAFGIAPDMAAQVHPLVRRKLIELPVEDFRIDFEDGFGHRSDA